MQIVSRPGIVGEEGTSDCTRSHGVYSVARELQFLDVPNSSIINLDYLFIHGLESVALRFSYLKESEIRTRSMQRCKEKESGHLILRCNAYVQSARLKCHVQVGKCRRTENATTRWRLFMVFSKMVSV